MRSFSIRLADAKRKHPNRMDAETFEQFSERARQEYPRMATRARMVSDHSVLE